MSAVLLIFIDGIGIGRRDPSINPLAAFEPAVLRFYSEGRGPFPRQGLCLPTDACLGAPGVPQSATGQTTLLTGIDAAARLGRHLQGFPTRQLREIIQERSLFVRLKKHGLTATFANTYTPEFFTKRPRRLSVSTVMAESAQVRLRNLNDLLEGRSLFMDFTNDLLIRKGYQVPLRDPAEAADILISLALEHDLCFYEYFLTDLVGHRGRLEDAVVLLSRLDSFLFEVVNRVPLDHLSLIIASDHGNIEEMDHSRHTKNPVPTLLWGEAARQAAPFGRRLSLVDIVPLIESALFADPRQGRRRVPAEEGQEY
jgi:2,3-bisphosphoglycerate-independent phosphoglycerate mutase